MPHFGGCILLTETRSEAVAPWKALLLPCLPREERSCCDTGPGPPMIRGHSRYPLGQDVLSLSPHGVPHSCPCIPGDKGPVHGKLF